MAIDIEIYLNPNGILREDKRWIEWHTNDAVLDFMYHQSKKAWASPGMQNPTALWAITSWERVERITILSHDEEPPSKIREHDLRPDLDVRIYNRRFHTQEKDIAEAVYSRIQWFLKHNYYTLKVDSERREQLKWILDTP